MFDAQILAQNIINGADSFPLLAVPFFMLAGEMMNAGGLSRRIVNVALALVGHVRGGLGYVAILAACILAALSGSAVADAAALSALADADDDQRRPRQGAGRRADRGGRHHRAGHPAQHRLRDVRRGRRRVDLQAVHGRHRPRRDARRRVVRARGGGWCARRTSTPPPRQTLGAGDLAPCVDGSWALVLPMIIIVGLKFGVFTPTEAAVVAAVYALFVSTCVYRELKLSQLYATFVAAAKTTSVVMFLVAAAMVSSWLITVADMPTRWSTCCSRSWATRCC